MKTKLNKLSLLDECVSSDYNNLISLISTSFHHFNLAYSVCKESIGEENIDSVKFTPIDDDHAIFDVRCKDKESIQIDRASSIIDIQKTDSGVSLHIFLKKEGDL